MSQPLILLLQLSESYHHRFHTYRTFIHEYFLHLPDLAHYLCFYQQFQTTQLAL